METILVANEKGGTAKTATCLMLSACLTALGYRVLIVDTDPSGNLSKAALQDGYPEKVLYDVFTETCHITEAIYETPFGDVLPTEKKTPTTGKKKTFGFHLRKNLWDLFATAVGIEGSEQFLKIILKDNNLEEYYDFQIVDSASSDNLLITNAVVASDSVILPIEPTGASSDGLLMFLDSIQEIAHKHNNSIHVDGMVFARFSDTWKARRELIDEITFMARNRDIYIYNNKFRISASVETSQTKGKPILEYINNQDNGVYDAMNFTLEFLARRNLEPKKLFPGVIRNEENAWCFRKNGNKYYTYTMDGETARLESYRLKKGDLDNPDFIEAIGKTIFFDKMNLEAYLISQFIHYIPE